MGKTELKNKQIKPADDYAKEIAHIYGGQFRVTGKYQTAKTSVKHLCTVCDFTITIRPNKMLYGMVTCPSCDHAKEPSNLIHLKRMGHSLLEAAKLAYPTLAFQSVGAGVKAKAVFTCTLCQTKQSRNLITLKSSPCIGCGRAEKSRKLRDSHDSYVARIRAIWGNKVQVVGSYVSTKRKVRHKCLECFNTWKVSPLNSLHRNSGCPYCANRAKRGHLSKGAKIVDYQLGDRQVKLQGYEPAALDYMLKFGISAKDIHVESDGSVPVVEYKVRKRRHRYFPDMFVESTNTIVEVKSLYTLGFGTGRMCRKFWSRNRLKAIACRDQGYTFVLLLMDAKGNRLRLPKNWPLLTKEQVAVGIAELNNIKQPKF